MARNFASPFGELDIVAWKEGTLCFVEVKTRRRTDYGLPCQSVHKNKQVRLRKTAETFLGRHPRFGDSALRMDIVEIVKGPKSCSIRHLENAF